MNHFNFNEEMASYSSLFQKSEKC